MKHGVLTAQKLVGETPLEVIEHIRRENQIAEDVPMAYAGRLDPMADGLLLILVGDECARRKEYEALEKEYEFELLLGIATDTYDVMGVAQNREIRTVNCELSSVTSALQSFVGEFEQPYPPYSSARVGGHPLFWWARAGRLDEIAIPTHTVTVYSAQIMQEQSIPLHVVAATAAERIHCVQRGDFRQQEVLAAWEQLDVANPDNPHLQVVTCRIVCSSGTYVRSICHEIGQQLGCGALASRITRRRIGNYQWLSS